MFMLQHGRHSTKTTTLFLLLAISLSTIALLAYANDLNNGNTLDGNGLGCTIVCKNDTDCDDNNNLTADTCNDANTCNATCANTPCDIACSADSDCNDNNNSTTDNCNNAGTCDANCSNTPCSVACDSNSDCDDSNSETIDSCNNDATCESSCTNIAKKHIIEPTEVKDENTTQSGPFISQLDQDAQGNQQDQNMVSDQKMKDLIENGLNRQEIFNKQEADPKLKTLQALFSEINIISNNPNISIENEFITPTKSPKIKNLGSDQRVKQNITITNESDQNQTALITIELTTPFEKFKKQDEEFTATEEYKKWKAQKNKVTFQVPDENAIEIETVTNAYIQFTETDGYFNWKDMVDANANPTIFIKKTKQETKIYLTLQITLKGNETREIDPIYDLNTSRAGKENFTARFDGAKASDNIGRTGGSGLGVQLVNVDNNAYANDLVITTYLADTQGRTDNGAVYLIKDIDAKSGDYLLDTDTNFDARFDGASNGDNIGRNYVSGLGVQVVNADNEAYANDLLITAIYANTQGLTDNGALYLIKDINGKSGTYLLDTDANFDARFDGASTSEQLGGTDHSGLGVQLVNTDNNAYANDLLITAIYANTQGLTDNGTVYLIKDIGEKSGTYSLGTEANFDARFDGAKTNDTLGRTYDSGVGVQLVNADNEAYANDLIITAIIASTQGLSMNGAVYLIKDINGKDGTYLLDTNANFDARFDGAKGSDFLGYNYESGLGVQVVNADNNAYANDLLITAINADTQGRADNGTVYLIKDIGEKDGDYLLDTDANFDARFDGASNGDNLGYTYNYELGVELVNADNNAYANDLLITTIYANTQGLSRNGAVYLIKDIDKKDGDYLLDTDTNFDARFDGANTEANLGRTLHSGVGVQLVNVDNQAYANDLLITAAWGDTQGLTDNGTVYLIKDINGKDGDYLLDTDANFDARFDGAKEYDCLGNTADSGLGVQLVNVDNGAYANDLVITAKEASTQGLSKNGAVYLIKDIDKKDGDYLLDTDTNFDARFDGATTNEYLGYTYSELGVQVVNVDNGVYANDLIITAYYADTQGLEDNGALYLIKDIGEKSGTYLLDTDANFDARFDGATAGDNLGYTSNAGLGVQLVNADNEAYANDLIITAIVASTQGLSWNGAVYFEEDLMDVNSPDVNVTKINGNPFNQALPPFSYARDGNLSIDFNVFDADNDRIRVDINYSTTNTMGSGTVIARDLNLTTEVCPSQKWDDNVSMCSWDWNIFGVTDNNYYILIYATGFTSSDFNTSGNNFLVDNNAPKIYLLVPADGSTVTEQTVTFDVNKIHHSDVDIDSIAVGINGTTSGDFDASSDCTADDGNYLCSYTETAMANGSNTLDVNASDLAGNPADTNTSTFTGAFNIVPDLNIWQVDGWDFNAALPEFSYTVDGNLPIKFRTSDADDDDLNFNMWYDTSENGKTNKIIGDINLSIESGHGNCDTNAKTGMVCSWDFNTYGISDNNYWITIEINDGTDTNTMPSLKSFKVDNNAPICSQFAVYSNAYGDYYKNSDTVHLEVACNAIDLNVTFDLADIDDQTVSGLCESGGSGTEEDPFILTTIAEVQAMENNLSAWYELCQDIDGSATSGWNGDEGFDPIGASATPFSGNFDGKGYGITGLYIDRPAESNIGLFGYLTGSISNLGVSNADITGNSTVGALVGMLFNGTIDNSYSSGTVSAGSEAGGLVGYVLFSNSQISDSYSTASVSCPQSAGGLVGQAIYGTINRSYATGNVLGTNSLAGFVGHITKTLIYDSYATGSVTGTGWVGGLVGYKDDDARIYRSYSTGAVSGSSYVGGLVGYDEWTQVFDSYWDTETSGQDVSDGGTGKSTVEMQQQATFTDWDFSSIWNIDEGTSYPYVDHNYSLDHTVSASNGLADGEKTVSFNACDAAGNCDTTPTDTITLDNTAPTTKDNDFNNLWNNNDQNVQFSCSDGTGAGCKNFYYSIIGDTNYQFAWGTDQNIGIVFDTDGNYGVFYWSDDSVDQNAAAKLIYMAIDQTAPTVSISSPSSGSTQTSTTVTLQYTGDDATSGIAKYYVKADGSWIDNSTSTSYTFSSQSVASHTYYIRATDNADNNSSDASVSVTILSPPGPGPESTTETGVSRPSGGAAAEHLPPPEAVPCSSDADCETGYRCVSGKCARFFDVKILRADTPIKAGEQFDFVYLLRNPFGKPIDAEVEYWLEKDGKKVVEGREVVFVGGEEEAQFESNLLLLEDMLGKYRFVVQLIHEGTEVFATKDIEIKTSVPLTLDLHISRLPEEISLQPFTIEILVGTNFDERTQVRLNQVIMRGNEILWKSDKPISVEVSRTIAQRLPVLQPGEYRLTITATSGEATTSIVRSFNVKTKVVAGPSISDIIQEKAVMFSIIALLLIIAAILAWHYLVIKRFVSQTHPAKGRIKFIYFSVFAIAFFALLGFTAYLLADLLREFALNELYGLMESSYGVAAQQLAADAWNYVLATSYGRQVVSLAQSIGLLPLG